MLAKALLLKGAIGLAATGVAAAAVSGAVGIASAGADTPSPAPATAPSGTGQNGHAPDGKRPGAHPLLRHVMHGEFTVGTKDGPQTLDLQRGQVAAVTTTTLVVTSRDGFKQTYTMTSDTKYRPKKNAETASDVAVGDRVGVVAKDGKALRVIEPKGPAPIDPAPEGPAQ